MDTRYGAGVARALLDEENYSIYTLARAKAAAASEARMAGCPLPVVINSGSGNQGMTASLPVIVYAEGLQKTREELYRALDGLKEEYQRILVLTELEGMKLKDAAKVMGKTEPQAKVLAHRARKALLLKSKLWAVNCWIRWALLKRWKTIRISFPADKNSVLQLHVHLLKSHRYLFLMTLQAR